MSFLSGLKIKNESPMTSPFGLIWTERHNDSHSFESFKNRSSMVNRLAQILATGDYEEDYILYHNGKKFIGKQKQNIVNEALIKTDNLDVYGRKLKKM